MPTPSHAATTESRSPAREALATFRARAARIGLQFSWIMLASVFVAAARSDVLADPRVIGPAIATGLWLTALSFVRWDRALRTPQGEIILSLWALLLVGALATASTVPELSDLVLGLYFALIVFSAVLASTVPLIVITTLIIAAYVLVPWLQGDPRLLEDLFIPILTMVMIAMMAGLISQAFWRETIAGLRRMGELRRRETDFQRLYEVTRTLSVGEDLEEVLPALVGHIGAYLDADVGFVALFDTDQDLLEVVSPIWTNGHTLEVSGYRMQAGDGGFVQQVLASGQAQRRSGLDTEADRHGVLSELGVRNAVAAPLRIESETLGVIVFADKQEGEFDDGDVEQLASLSAAAALVVAHLGRYRQATESTRRMEELAEMKTDFVSVVSHELRTPLTTIIGSLDTLARPQLAPDKPAARELLDTARNQAERLRRLIEDLLMVSRIENYAMPHRPERLHLATTLREAVGSVPGASTVTSIDVNPTGATIEADTDHLRRIIINLVGNAMKYGHNTPIEIGAVVGDTTVEIAVVDHGPGVPPELRDRVFARFTQLEPSQTRSKGGAGLGLSIVQGLVDNMGGSIQVRDTPGGGATFVIRLPTAPRSVGEDRVSASGGAG